MSKTVCFTGHREVPGELLAELNSRLDNMLERLYSADFRTFICGGAEGFDTLAALRVLALRERRADVRLLLYLPYERVGSVAYRRVLAAADGVEYVARRFGGGQTLERDRRMVDAADVCIAFYLNGRTGGTLYTVRYANRRGVPVVNIAPRGD